MVSGTLRARLLNYLFVFHDPPYGTERTFNGLRWAKEVLGEGTQLRVFLFGDAVVSILTNQTVPSGYYNVGRMVESLARHGGVVGACGTCMDARGIEEERMVKGAHRSSMAELAEWTAWADHVINV
ncbi:MAG: DsrE family protein [Actinomycetota bacterium]|nr:DsrE family protein [Actinomycetota bacterium]